MAEANSRALRQVMGVLVSDNRLTSVLSVFNISG